jgi:uncharacterized protein involved in type VI secretion and phage assembly
MSTAMNDQTLMEVVDRMRNRFYGKYRGTVTEVNDDGRIKALVPAVLGDQETGWCLPCVPYAGKDVGIAFLPEEDAGVWIEFEGGDVSYPIWVGCYWHDEEQPRRMAAEVKVIKSKANEIVLDDKDHAITITEGKEKGRNTVALNRDGIALARGSGKVDISDGKVSINDAAMEVT